MSTNTKRHAAGREAPNVPDGETVPAEAPTNSDTPVRRRRVPEITYSVLVFIGLLVVWQVVVKMFDVSNILVPAPTAVASSLVDGFQDGSLVTHSIVTLKEILLGFGIAVGSALVSAVLITQFRMVERVLFPLLILTQTIPKVALAPLLIIWFGIGISSKVLTVALIAFFPLLINAILGFRSAAYEQVEMLRSFGASRMQVMRHLQIPSALPHIFAGLEVAVILSVTGAVVAEFVGSSEGLGYLIQASNFTLDVARTFAVIVVLSAIGIALHAVVVQLGKWLVFWTATPTDTAGEV
ncbi:MULTISPECIES: ABC transporter permease [Streptomyces]|uniref:ABC transporter permease n=2 Tax=Streptomyces griseoaurantiacus TaxID=68213 RepID=A0ABZ1UYW7_9ACTN|nr:MULTISPECIES: ABC transporter permease [Streptomyces]MBA5220201.1 ABC transporter permease [Streptomyces griseoaurantiacus]MCF0087611.1 putative aliphatic sulfonates transport permease protein SsuC [Streptomyces sp. MH192]MCF0099648.1 putative aliphatic sulfonates transport permease protein SsuC [Streptomyces sp. MH191]MDX3090237.1 ABC transporter permease [Streptomyces sp. ME12-02E]MDX3332381.1 ABC transporter permease [Streptomyces sp. ME02-6978a]